MQGAEQPASSYFHLNGGQLTSEQGPLLTDRRRRRRARPSPGSSSDFDISIHRGGVKARPRWCHAASLVGSVSTALRQPGRIRTRGGDAAFSQLGKRVPRGPKQRPDIKRSYGRPIRENTLGKPKYLCCKERGWDGGPQSGRLPERASRSRPEGNWGARQPRAGTNRRGAAGRRSFRERCRTRRGNFPARRPPTRGSRPAPIHRGPAVPAGGIRPAQSPHAPAPRQGSGGEEPAGPLAAFACRGGRRGWVSSGRTAALGPTCPSRQPSSPPCRRRRRRRAIFRRAMAVPAVPAVTVTGPRAHPSSWPCAPGTRRCWGCRWTAATRPRSGETASSSPYSWRGRRRLRRGARWRWSPAGGEPQRAPADGR